MLEMKLDEAGLASARFLLIDVPLSEKEQNTVERIGTRLDADSGKWLTEKSESSLDQAIEEVAATSRLPRKHARTALVESIAVQQAALRSTAHSGVEPHPDVGETGPFYIVAHPLLEASANDARAKQRAYELSKLLPRAEAAVIAPDGEDIALYKSGALYNPATGEQLTPAG